MARRFVYFQGAAVPPEYPLKMLFEGPDGFYVGGWNQEPVLIAPLSNPTYPVIRLRGITATGKGQGDWLAAGWARDAAFLWRIVFYGPAGLIAEYTFADWSGILTAGHFASIDLQSADLFRWATATANGTGTSPDFIQGFVLPSVFAGTRLNPLGSVTQTMRQSIVPNPALSYAVFLGDESANPATYPNGNPWLASAGGSFTRLSTDLNAAIPRSDLIGLTLYERDQDFLGAAPWANAGEHTLTITPHAITTGGTVATGSTFPVKYQAPDPAQYFTWDASLWVQPSAP